MTRWVVTGAAGFVGGRLVRGLLAGGADVLAASRSAPADVPADRWARWAAGDPLPLAPGDVVVHAAAHRPRPDDPDALERSLRVNAVATAALVEAAARAGVRRFVYLSAGNAYRPLGRPSTEDDPLWPVGRASAYLGSKICGEWAVASAPASLPTTSLRPSAIYGPGMPPGMMTTFWSRLAAGEPVTVADGGRYRADLVHVDDVIAALLAAVDRGVSGPINVGGGGTHRSLDIAEAIARRLDQPPTLIHVDPPAGDAPGFTVLDTSRASAELGYTARSLEAGLSVALVGGV